MKALKILAIVVFAGGGLFAIAATVGRSDPVSVAIEGTQEDTRTAVLLPSPARNGVLKEMRQMLAAVNGILSGAASKDGGRMAEAARSGGMIMAVDMDPAMMSRLPEEFRRLGMSTHRDFDALAERIDAGQPLDTVLVRLAQLTGKCVACHATYRLEVEDTGGP